MAFFMHGSGKRPDQAGNWLFVSLLAMLVLLSSACSQTQQEFGIQLTDLRASGTSKNLSIRASQEVRLSQEAREALVNGVPLRLKVELAVQNSGRGSELSLNSLTYEIRYLPLSDHYQLTGPVAGAAPRTFPRLRHVLAELKGIEWRLGDMNNEPGGYKLRMRSHLDRSGMPGPMQLPMLFSADWVHDSGWVSHEFQVSG